MSVYPLSCHTAPPPWRRVSYRPRTKSERSVSYHKAVYIKQSFPTPTLYKISGGCPKTTAASILYFILKTPTLHHRKLIHRVNKHRQCRQRKKHHGRLSFCRLHKVPNRHKPKPHKQRNQHRPRQRNGQTDKSHNVERQRGIIPQPHPEKTLIERTHGKLGNARQQKGEK